MLGLVVAVTGASPAILFAVTNVDRWYFLDGWITARCVISGVMESTVPLHFGCYAKR
jgi:hypothetical protein